MNAWNAEGPALATSPVSCESLATCWEWNAQSSAKLVGKWVQ
jgi:hypothetical protein